MGCTEKDTGELGQESGADAERLEEAYKVGLGMMMRYVALALSVGVERELGFGHLIFSRFPTTLQVSLWKIVWSYIAQ